MFPLTLMALALSNLNSVDRNIDKRMFYNGVAIMKAAAVAEFWKWCIFATMEKFNLYFKITWNLLLIRSMKHVLEIRIYWFTQFWNILIVFPPNTLRATHASLMLKCCGEMIHGSSSKNFIKRKYNTIKLKYAKRKRKKLGWGWANGLIGHWTNLCLVMGPIHVM